MNSKCQIFNCPKGEYVICQKHKEKHNKLMMDEALSNIKVCECCECSCGDGEECGKHYRRNSGEFWWDISEYLFGYVEDSECTYCTYDLYSDPNTYHEWLDTKCSSKFRNWEQSDDEGYFYVRQMQLASAEVEKDIDPMNFHRPFIFSAYSESYHLFKRWKDKCDQKDKELQELKKKYDQLYYSPDQGPGYLEAKTNYQSNSKK